MLTSLINKKYLTDFIEDYIKSGISVLYFYKESDFFIPDEVFVKISITWVKLFAYKNKKDIYSVVSNLEGKIFVTTLDESMVSLSNKIRKKLWQKITDNPEIFRNKFLQRDIISKKFPETVVWYKKFDNLEDLKNYSFVESDFPMIIKPISGVQSSWVVRVSNKSDILKVINYLEVSLQRLSGKKLWNYGVICEDFVDWQMYSIDYFVDEEQNLFITVPVELKFGFDFGFDDFCNTLRIISYSSVKKLPPSLVYDFVKKTVLWWGIRNTFVHHEFKVNSKGEYKTIEINWRVGGFRLEMYRNSLWFEIMMWPYLWKKISDNLFEQKKLISNVAVFAFYPDKEWVLKWFNYDLLEDAIDSYLFRYSFLEQYIGQKVGPTSQWYSRLWVIVLVEEDENKFYEWVDFIQKNYFNFIILE